VSDERTVVTSAVLRDWPLPLPDEGKESRGQVLAVGGSRGTPGALLLAGEAALRAGAGKVTLGVAIPEALVLGLAETPEGHLAASAADELSHHVEAADVLLAGTGMVDAEAAVALLGPLLEGASTTVVLDALGSALLAEAPEAVHALDGRCVLSVNPSELEHTAGGASGDPGKQARLVAERSRVVVLCGGTEKLVVTPEGRSWVVREGGPGLGISGSGDVQAGIVAGLLARGADAAQAAVWGAHLHARAGQRLGASVGTLGYLARELPGEVPRVLAELG
jgi:hydroxyethylthiazole kinase-like uncharacterized protein yjeF